MSDSDNLASFGRYASDQPHGHNFVVEVAITGKVDETTGMVINMTEVDRLVRSRVIGELDGKYLNREVAFFAGRSPTTENLVEFVRAELESALTEEAVLTAVTVRESERLWSRWESDRPSAPRLDKSMMALTRAYDFSASHRLHAAGLSDERNRELFGKCNNPNGHGHNYEIEITIAGKPDERSGMLFSLDELDEAVRLEVLDIMDHKNLNLDVADFANVNPTSEMLAVVIWRRLARRLPTTGDPRLAKVVVRETARNSFEYCGD